MILLLACAALLATSTPTTTETPVVDLQDPNAGEAETCWAGPWRASCTSTGAMTATVDCAAAGDAWGLALAEAAFLPLGGFSTWRPDHPADDCSFGDGGTDDEEAE